MDFQVSTLCDYAADYQGKLCLQGSFDTLIARQFPVVHPSCALALRLCFSPEDQGEHEISFTIVDDDGKAIAPDRMPIKGQIKVALPEGTAFDTRNLIMNLQGLSFAREGTYSVDITVDGELSSRIPLRLVKLDPQQQQQG